jgi:glycosyltransferase involved in cell wall biosynthesis
VTTRRPRRADAVAGLRRVARRPRGWIAAARSHRATDTAMQGARDAFERAALVAQARPGRAARATDWDRLTADVAALPAAPALDRSVTIVLVAPDEPSTLDRSTKASLREAGAGLAANRDGANVDVVVAHPEAGERAAAAAARAARDATSELICFLLATSVPLGPGWLARLAAAIDAPTVTAAIPVAVHPMREGSRATRDDGRVRARGVSVAVHDDAPELRAESAGAIATLDPDPDPVAGGTAACLLVNREAYVAAGSLPDFEELDIAVFQLCRELRTRGGEVVVVPNAVVVDHRPVASRSALTTPVATKRPGWRAYVESHGAELMRAADPLVAGRLRIALTVAAPSAKVAPRWGDWHLAEAFARALRARGHLVRVQTLDHADDLAGRASDVHCVVRGLNPVRRTPGQAHVIWVISHPEQVTSEECDTADLVLVASMRFAEALRARTQTPVEVMLQATDITRFRPVPAQAIHAHDVAVVAKSRDVFRTSVADAIAGGLRPAIYGSGWEPFVDPALVVSNYVPNEDLPAVYSSVGVLLNDHWQTMHEWGFVSNRLFDALACETPVISDNLPEIDEMFDGAVLTYRDAAELQHLVQSTLADRSGARARAARGRELIAGRHTFDHRAEQFLDALARHDLLP